MGLPTQAKDRESAGVGRKILRLWIFVTHRELLSFGFTDLARNKPPFSVATASLEDCVGLTRI